MTFRELSGNTDVRHALAEMVSAGRVPHAIMFYENDGCGAFAIVQAFAQMLLCSNHSGEDSCGECPSCGKVSKLIHPDVHYVFPVTTGNKVGGASKDLHSDLFLQWFRELAISNPYFMENEFAEALGFEGKNSAINVREAKSILDKISVSTVQGGYRVVVVYLPERMNTETANRLLKSIEEPPEKTVFFMITHAPEKILQTISSRCQGIRIQPFDKEDMKAVLINQFDKTEEEASSAIMASGGSVGAALQSIANAEDETVDFTIFQALMDSLLKKDLASALEAGEAMAAIDSREKQKAFCKFAGACLRKIFMLQQGMPDLAGLLPSEESLYSALASGCRKSFPRTAMAQFDKAMMLIDRNVNQKVVFCDLVNHLFFTV